MNDPRLLKLKKEKQEYIFKNFPGVVGVGISEKVSNGKKTGKKAITVYVEKKVSTQALAADKVINKNAVVMGGLTPDEIDVKEVGKIRALNTLPKASAADTPYQHQQKVRPVPTGVSEGHYQITAGTAGPLVKQRIGGLLARVSNNHVYADENRANINDAILQPGPYDNGTEAIGTLLRFVPMTISEDVANKVDCALRSANGTTDIPDVLNVDGTPTSIVPALEGQSVVKSGRTTGVTRGTITDTAASLLIGYDQGGVLFEDQIIVESTTAFSQGGDSGSGVWIEENGKLHWVALLFAGNDDGSFTVCNHATEVANLLGVDLYSPVAPPVEPPAEPPVGSPDNHGLVIGGIVAVLLLLIGWLAKVIFKL
jgi:hypothetical protein